MTRYDIAFNSMLVHAEQAQQALLEAVARDPVEIYIDGDAILDINVNNNQMMSDMESHGYTAKFSKIFTSSYHNFVNCYRFGSNAIALTTSSNITDWTHPDIIMFNRGIFYVFVSKSARINLDQLMKHLSMIHNELFYIMNQHDYEWITNLIESQCKK